MSTRFRLHDKWYSKAVAVCLLLGFAGGLSACKGREEAPVPPSPAPAATPAQPGMTPDETQQLQTEEQAAPAPAPAPGTAPTTPAVPGAPAAAPPGAPAPAAPATAPAAATAGPVNPGKLLPVDEAKRAPGLAETRNKLQDAVKRKDANAVMGMLAPNVRTDGQQGPEAFRKAWNLDDPNSRFWTEMATVLRQGGSFGEQGGNNVFNAPHSYGRLPQGLEPTQYGIITGERVNVRKLPNRTAETAAQLTYEIVKLAPNPTPQTETIDGETHPWVPIVLPDGQMGYVYGRFIRQANGLHATFERVDGQWKLTNFGAGQ